MRVLVCGGRDYADLEFVYSVLDWMRSTDPNMAVGCGFNPKDKRYQGADELAYDWAISRGVRGCCYPAHWDLLGRSAGPRRNERQLQMFAPDRLVAFPGGAGTAHMMKIARDAGVQVITPTHRHKLERA